MLAAHIFMAIPGGTSGRITGTQALYAYVARSRVDNQLSYALETGKHIIVYGSPGVGKSTLTATRIDSTQVVHVRCQPRQHAPDIYRSILAEVGARLRTETKLTKKRHIGASLKIFSGTSERGSESTEVEVTIDLGNVGDIFRALRGHTSRRLIVLNDFNALSRSAQRTIVRDLQYIMERTTYRLILTGTWTSPAYLTDLSESLSNFVTEVHVPAWSSDDCSQFLTHVEKSMNIVLAPGVRRGLTDMSAGSVRDLTEYCRELLRELGIDSRLGTTRGIDDGECLDIVVRQRMGRLFGRYRDGLARFLSAEFQGIDGIDVTELLLAYFDQNLLSDDHVSEAQSDSMYTFSELAQALRDVIADRNAPRQLKLRNRQTLIELLCAAAMRDPSHVSASLEDFLAASPGVTIQDTTGFRRLSKLLLRSLSRLNPQPLVYDPRSVALVAVEPAFRAFLRSLNGQVEGLVRTTTKPLDSRKYWRYAYLRSPVLQRAKLNRWRLNHPQDESTESSPV